MMLPGSTHTGFVSFSFRCPSPFLTHKNKGDHGLTASKFFGYGSLCHSFIPHFKNFRYSGIVKFGLWGFLTVKMPMYKSSFLAFVPMIIGISTKKKMFRVYTRWVIAFMQYMKFFWNKAIKQNPNQSVGSSVFSFITDHTITKTVLVSLPFLTSIWCDYGLLKHPIDKRRSVNSFGSAFINHKTIIGGFS